MQFEKDKNLQLQNNMNVESALQLNERSAILTHCMIYETNHCPGQEWKNRKNARLGIRVPKGTILKLLKYITLEI